MVRLDLLKCYIGEGLSESESRLLHLQFEHDQNVARNIVQSCPFFLFYQALERAPFIIGSAMQAREIVGPYLNSPAFSVYDKTLEVLIVDWWNSWADILNEIVGYPEYQTNTADWSGSFVGDKSSEGH